MLYRSTDRLCRCGAPVQYLSHSASFHSLEKYAPPNAGTKHLGRCNFPSKDAGIVFALCWVSGRPMSFGGTPPGTSLNRIEIPGTCLIGIRVDYRGNHKLFEKVSEHLLN
jgi:hypothetical protein